MKFSFDYRLVLPEVRTASVPTLMYHGTDAENLPIILSQGLIPNPKKRIWHQDESASFYHPSRAGLPGIYLTTNLMTALSSAGKGRTGQDVLVVVRVSSGSLLADEDDFKFRLNSSLTNHEYSIMQLYAGWQALKRGLISSDRVRSQTEELITNAENNFVNSMREQLNHRLKGGLHDREREILTPFLQQAFYVTLTRKAAYVDKYSWGYESDNYGIPRPEKGLAESNFKQIEDRLTRLLKRVGRPEHNENVFNQTARIETPITFSGKNKIVAIIHELGYEPGMGTKIRVVYPRSGQVPEAVIREWIERVGSWNPVV